MVLAKTPIILYTCTYNNDKYDFIYRIITAFMIVLFKSPSPAGRFTSKTKKGTESTTSRKTGGKRK
jgi:hypothetical protein